MRKKAEEFSEVIKMGRTQLQDAVPMSLGQSFEAYAATFEEEVIRLKENADLFLEVNMGATAIGTGINAGSGCAPHTCRQGPIWRIGGLGARSMGPCTYDPC